MKVCSERGDVKLTYDHCARYVLRFGKYRGCQLSDVLVLEPSYLRWLRDNLDSADIVDRIRVVLRGRKNPPKRQRIHKATRSDPSPEQCADFRLKHGKYRGLTIAQAGAIQPDYLDWLLKNSRNRKLRNRVRIFCDSRISLGGHI